MLHWLQVWTLTGPSGRDWMLARASFSLQRQVCHCFQRNFSTQVQQLGVDICSGNGKTVSWYCVLDRLLTEIWSRPFPSQSVFVKAHSCVKSLYWPPINFDKLKLFAVKTLHTRGTVRLTKIRTVQIWWKWPGQTHKVAFSNHVYLIK